MAQLDDNVVGNTKDRTYSLLALVTWYDCFAEEVNAEVGLYWDTHDVSLSLGDLATEFL